MSTVPSAPSAVQAVLARNKLGTFSLLHFSLTAATPLTVIAGGVVVMFALAGEIGIPLGYLIIAVCLWLFSVGYTTMSRHITNAGAFYAFIARGIGRVPGVAAAWVAATAYCAMQISLYGLLGLTAESVLARMGLDASWWVCALVAWLLIGLLGTRAVDINAKVLAILLAVEIAVILLFSVSNFANAADGLPLAAMSPSTLGGEAAGAMLALAVTGFIGFESPTVYGEEAKDRRRTVARATLATVGILAFIYIASSWSIIAAVGADGVVDAAIADPSLMFTLAGDQLGAPWAVIGEVMLLTSVTAAALSFHNTTARYLFALGRERVAPAWLGRTSPRTSSPVTASLTQTVVSGAVIIAWAALGLDPLVHLFYYMSTSAGIGLLALIATCAVAVIVYFARDRRGESLWATRIAPVFAVVALLWVLYLSVLHFHTLLGVEKGSTLPVLVPILFAVLALLGAGWGAYLKRGRPEVYAGIGHGAKAALVTETSEPVGVAGGR
ncbi:APC family permease [Glycomyces algeriensis]|uniref:Amino acid permease n=1 Tax=Glycomyces algeriensis TaxID=256037 RepID=A0A9W6LHZ1_9ACTN|nr:APC family permease [Glycomyces algeriensis]MDA1368362.1 APC family permease [Glycomyces algeriensis]MDR7351805.1 amino acid transporter [Glycomyces algeriensis]GLI44532.1 amino acid permease [Glycomyces algeriensis]